MKVVIFDDDGREIATGYFMWVPERYWEVTASFASDAGCSHAGQHVGGIAPTEDPWLALSESLTQTIAYEQDDPDG